MQHFNFFHFYLFILFIKIGKKNSKISLKNHIQIFHSKNDQFSLKTFQNTNINFLYLYFCKFFTIVFTFHILNIRACFFATGKETMVGNKYIPMTMLPI